MAKWRTAGHKLCQLTVTVREEFFTRMFAFYVAGEDGSSNVCTGVLDGSSNVCTGVLVVSSNVCTGVLEG